MDRDNVIWSLRDCAEELGKTPTQEEYSEWADHTHHVATYRFDSWNDALRAAGLELNRKTPISP